MWLSLRYVLHRLDEIVHTRRVEEVSKYPLLEEFKIRPGKDKPSKRVNPIEDTVWAKAMQEARGSLLFYHGGAKLPAMETDAYTVEKFSLWRYNQTGLSVPLRAFTNDEMPFDVPRESIKGQVGILKEGALETLDYDMQEGVLFRRKLTPLYIPLLDSEGNAVKLNAWMYIGMDQLRQQIIWDQSYYRSTKGKEYTLAPIRDDYNHRCVPRYYQHQHEISNGVFSKCYLHLHRGLNDPPATAEPAPAYIIQPAPAPKREAAVVWRSDAVVIK